MLALVMALFPRIRSSVESYQLPVSCWIVYRDRPGDDGKQNTTDIPHINTPVMLSRGPKSRQLDGSTTSPYPTVE